MMHDMFNNGLWGNLFNLTLTIALFGLIIYLVLRLFKRYEDHEDMKGQDALNRLNRKLIEGKISEEEYERKRKLIDNR